MEIGNGQTWRMEGMMGLCIPIEKLLKKSNYINTFKNIWYSTKNEIILRFVNQSQNPYALCPKHPIV